MSAVAVLQPVGRDRDANPPEEGNEHEGCSQGSQGKEDGHKGDQEIAANENGKAARIVVLVEMSRTGNHTQEERQLIAIDLLPGINEFFHGNRKIRGKEINSCT